MKVLLLSGYDAVSHRIWRERIQSSFPNWQWTTLTQPPRHFAWRLRGNAMLWAANESVILNATYDLLIATSMVDLSSLRGLVPGLAQIPTLLYFHENQFAYPEGRQRSDNVEPMLVPIYSALCSDRLIFNSHYNQSTFLKGASNLSKRLPEPLPAELFNKLESSEVIPVPLPNWQLPESTDANPEQLEVIWNHRWEYDKGPDLLLAIIEECWQQKLPIRFQVVGQQFREQPAAFEPINLKLHEIATHFKWDPGQWGFVNAEEEYKSLLINADTVLSTASHDFQGLAIQEACLMNCSALAPNDLAYPEYLPPECLYDQLQTEQQTATLVTDKLRGLLERKQQGSALPQANLENYFVEKVKKEIEEVVVSLS